MTKDIDDILPKGFGEMPDGRMWHPMDEENRQLRAERDALKLKVERLADALDTIDMHSVDGPTDEWIMVSKCEWENAYRSIDDILGDLREADEAIKEEGK